MPGAPEPPRRALVLDGEGGPDASWVEVEAAPADIPDELQSVANAAEVGDAEALEEAMRNLTVSINRHAEDGDTALHLACLHGHAKCVEILLAGGASVTARDEDGAVPLHDAAASGFPECVQLLLNAAARQGCTEEMLRATDVDGDTPLHHAARGNHVAIIQQLLAAGADASKENGAGKMPHQLSDAPTTIEACQRSSPPQ